MPSNQKTILVVDDDADVRAISVLVIERKGYRTLSAPDGPTALSLLESGEPIDLMILDLMMPGMDGFQTLEAARLAGFNNLPVVMLTAQSEDDQVIAGYTKGADYYLTKPLKPTALINIINFLIGDLTPEEKAKLEADL